MANVPKIDYTGPAKAGRHTSAQTESALNCMVLQPLDDYGTYNETGNESYVEKWKGPISAMLKVNDGFTCMGKKFIIGNARPDLTGGNWIRRFDTPSLPKNWYWMVKQIRVEQANPAGDHGTLVVDYVAKNSEWTVKDAGAGGRMDASKSQWSLEWQNRSATALIYLTNKYGKLKFIKWVNPAVKKEGEDKELDSKTDPDMATFAKMAIDAMQSQKVDSRIRLGKYQFVWKDAVYELPTECTPLIKHVNPQLVVDKYIAGVAPLLHYPVLKKVTAANFKTSQFEVFPKWDSATGDKGDPIAKYIDTETNFPKECPFEFNADYTYRWLKVSDNFSTDRITNAQLVYTRTEVWWGDLWWDSDFYNKNITDRWEIGGE